MPHFALENSFFGPDKITMAASSLPTRRSLVSAAALLSAPCFPAHAISRWSLPNGEVSLREPSFACGGSSYEAPILLGAGGSGAALSVSPSSSRPAVKGERVVLKVSWSSPGAVAAVRNEGAILERLKGVDGVERLLGRSTATKQHACGTAPFATAARHD